MKATLAAKTQSKRQAQERETKGQHDVSLSLPLPLLPSFPSLSLPSVRTHLNPETEVWMGAHSVQVMMLVRREAWRAFRTGSSVEWKGTGEQETEKVRRRSMRRTG